MFYIGYSSINSELFSLEIQLRSYLIDLVLLQENTRLFWENFWFWLRQITIMERCTKPWRTVGSIFCTFSSFSFVSHHIALPPTPPPPSPEQCCVISHYIMWGCMTISTPNGGKGCKKYMRISTIFFMINWLILAGQKHQRRKERKLWSK